MRTLTLWASSRSRPVGTLRAGVDLALDIAPGHGLALPCGVALDDHLDPAARAAVDGEARERCGRWRRRRSADLTVKGVDLAHVWELELLARCFVPAVRLSYGLPAAVAAAGAQRLVVRSGDAVDARLAAAILAPLGVSVSAHAGTAHRREVGRRRSPSLAAAAMSALGVPPRVRGGAVCLPYWHLQPVIASLASTRPGLRPVAADLRLPGADLCRAFGLTVRGGWIGVPGPRARAASRATIEATLRSAASSTFDEPFEAILDSHALGILREAASDTLASVQHARRALAGGGVRVGVIPFDSPEPARMLLAALRDRGLPALLVQHGFPARQGDPDMRLADHVAIWSERDRSLAPDRDPSTATVTGNPGAAHMAGMVSARRGGRGRSVVLVDYPGRLTARIDGRVSMRHVAAALQALAVARPATLALIRPHPADLEPGSYLALAARHPGLRVEIDARTPIETLLASCDLCVGALSTATLQACVLGVPTVFLDVTGIERPWPFDGSGAIPSAFAVDSLAEAIAAAAASREIAGRDAALDALGVRRDAVERVVGLIGELAHRGAVAQ